MSRPHDSHRDYSCGEHLSSDLLIRKLDGELSRVEAVQVQSHLSSCGKCKASYLSFARVSDEVERFVEGLTPAPPLTTRQELVRELSGCEAPIEITQRSADSLRAISSRKFSSSRPALRHQAWIAALAAAIVLGIAVLPHEKQIIGSSQAQRRNAPAMFDVNGEAFAPLPYSDPELPMSAPRIVEMQVPVASLASAGVALGSAENVVARADQTVLADVLLGIDGQPLGVHVLSADQ